MEIHWDLFFIILIGLLIAIFSSTQDISIDALRIEQVDTNENNIMAAAASMAVIGWWTGFKIGGLISLSVADYFEKNGFENYFTRRSGTPAPADARASCRGGSPWASPIPRRQLEIGAE